MAETDKKTNRQSDWNILFLSLLLLAEEVQTSQSEPKHGHLIALQIIGISTSTLAIMFNNIPFNCS